MAQSNAERQRLFRQRRIKTGERVRLEFKVTPDQAEMFKALTESLQASKTETFIKLCQAATEQNISEPVTVETPGQHKSLLAEVDAHFVRVSNLIAWSAEQFKNKGDKEQVFKLSSDVTKMSRRIQTRYPANK